MKKTYLKLILCSIVLSVLLLSPCNAFAAGKTPIKFISDFLKEIEYTSQIKLEFDDNIFLNDNDEEDDFKEIFTQTLVYKLPRDKYYFQMRYRGKYSYYNNEATGVLGHASNLLYSYRPFDNLSIGFRDDFNWLQDTKIRRTLGDEVLALGYIQNTPSLQLKHELSPEFGYTIDTYSQFLDVRDPSNDDYIDNKKLGLEGKVHYDFTKDKNVSLFLGFGHHNIKFTQISEKASTSERVFFGLVTKFPALFNVTHEAGFNNIRMDEENASESDFNDYKFALETTFSLYTKLKLAYQYNIRQPSLRRQYTQYTSDTASASLRHAINPKTSILLDYSFEAQDFNPDSMTRNQDQADHQTHIHSLKTGLSRKLMDWLTADLSYSYTRRNTDFVNEGYEDNKVSLELTAKY